MKPKATLLTLLFLCVYRFASAQSEYAATLPHLKLQVTILTASDDYPILRETFTTDDPYHNSVFCRSGFYDVR